MTAPARPFFDSTIDVSMTLAPRFNPNDFESRLYAEWESSGLFKPSGEGEPYTILLPPPNVTGTLHMGHAFQHTLMDALIRYHRMRGFDTLWQVGTDHAGIATEMLVTRQLEQAGAQQQRHTLGRAGFIDKVWQWKERSGDTILRQMRRLGASADWSRHVFSMDPQPSAAVIEAFVRLHQQGLIYRGQRLVNWDPALQTALSDLEVDNVVEQGSMWFIRYPLANGKHYRHRDSANENEKATSEHRDYLVVATTRPETLFGDTAVMVHPDDARYADLIGHEVILPLTSHRLTIIADAAVDPNFGSGVVKVTPAHDFNDYQVGQRHQLEIRSILTPQATLNGLVPPPFQGLNRDEARRQVVAALNQAGLLHAVQPHVLHIPRGDRSGQVIEPYLTDQWFVKMDELAKRGIERVSSGEVQLIPANWVNTYRYWLDNIQDWCISRQLWWGHRIPAWYDPEGRCYVGRSEEEVRRDHGIDQTVALQQDPDVLETWFSSQLWPFSTLGWPDAEAMAARGFSRYLPSDVLVTGFDILFFWVARMIMATDQFTHQVPFRQVYLTGLIRDSHGQKMSKSKGNVLDPIDIIDGISLDDLLDKRTRHLMQPKQAAAIAAATRAEFPTGIAAHGADALRLTITASATHGRDIHFDLSRAEGYKNFCNKLWNATRFVLMHTQDVEITAPQQALSTVEQWVIGELAQTITASHHHFAAYRFDLLAQSLYDFAWNTVCDWFLELAKPTLHQADTPVAVATMRHSLLRVLETLLRLLHPIMPFVTEELWRHVAPRLGISATTICHQPYPQSEPLLALTCPQASADVQWLQTVVSAIRQIRSELGVAPSQRISLVLEGGQTTDRHRFDHFHTHLVFLLKIDAIDWREADQTPSASAVVGDLTLRVSLAGLIDLDAEKKRLDKQILRVQNEIAKCQRKLSQDRFIHHAPAHVVEQERYRLAQWTHELNVLEGQRQTFTAC